MEVQDCIHAFHPKNLGLPSVVSLFPFCIVQYSSVFPLPDTNALTLVISVHMQVFHWKKIAWVLLLLHFLRESIYTDIHFYMFRVKYS